MVNPIGYACKLVGPPRVGVRGCTLARATPVLLREVVLHNIRALAAMVEYNITHGIQLFRISSDVVPLATHPSISFNWQREFADELAIVGKRIAESGLRVSMHPGQYTVINSPDDGVAERAAADLQYHADMLDLLGTGPDAKIVLHIGGVYGDRAAAIARFEQRFVQLSDSVKQRLIIENDERSFAIDDVCRIAKRLKIPVVLDNLHFDLLPPEKGDYLYWFDQCAKTWKKRDGLQKIHYSQQLPGGKPGSHSVTINAAAFMEFYRELKGRACAIMFEVKDKNLSAVKCLHCIQDPPVRRTVLTDSWAQYKYAILERSPNVYNRIRQLLKNAAPQALDYYTLIDTAMAEPLRTGPVVTTFQHVWGYFSKSAGAAEKKRALGYEEKLQQDLRHRDAAKKFLFRLAEKKNEQYLLDSLYFDL